MAKSKKLSEEKTEKASSSSKSTKVEKPTLKPKNNLIGKNVRLFSGRIFVIKEQKDNNTFILTKPNKEKEYTFNKQDFEILD